MIQGSRERWKVLQRFLQVLLIAYLEGKSGIELSLMTVKHSKQRGQNHLTNIPNQLTNSLNSHFAVPIFSLYDKLNTTKGHV